jgi:hypothetical protein
MSGVPPAASETMNLIGRAGQLCATAGANDSSIKVRSVTVRANINIFFLLRPD